MSDRHTHKSTKPMYNNGNGSTKTLEIGNGGGGVRILGGKISPVLNAILFGINMRFKSILNRSKGLLC